MVRDEGREKDSVSLSSKINGGYKDDLENGC